MEPFFHIRVWSILWYQRFSGRALSVTPVGNKVVFLTANKFTDQLVDSLKIQNKNKFIESFYQSDIIVIEDVDDLKNKKGTQKELCYLINNLIDRNKKIIHAFHWLNIQNPGFEDLRRIASILLNDCNYSPH